jgi:hypothetical protein
MVPAMTHALTPDEEIKILRVISALENTAEFRQHAARKHERLSFRRRVTLTLITQRGGPELSVVTRDISVGGVGFLSRRLFQADEMFVMHLPTAEDKCRLALCKVCYCKYVSSGLHNIGASFCEVADSAAGIPAQWVILASPRQQG